MNKDFYNLMEEYLRNYKTFLSGKYKKPTVNKHLFCLKTWVEFLTIDHSTGRFEEITIALCNSKFWAKRNYFGLDGYDESTIKSIIRKFLTFIKEKYGEDSITLLLDKL